MDAARPASKIGSQSDFVASTSMLHRPEAESGSRFTEQTFTLEKLGPRKSALIVRPASQAALNLQAVSRLVVTNVGS